jgi:4-amino-4-deoxy-L-arabinose transferase-like glycosyltransferase
MKMIRRRVASISKLVVILIKKLHSQEMNFKNKLMDIRFCIVIFFVVRLIGITNAPLEVSHNWRQTTVNMVSRNFLEIDNNIFFPRIDIAGEKSGITGMEFPLLNYICYIISKIFGYQHWYGRLVNLIVSSFGLWFFYKLIIKYFTKQVAFYSTIILTVSIWFQFSRKIMPDTFAMSMIIACIYFGTNYLENKKKDRINLFFYFLLLLFGLLAKLPSGYLLIVFCFFYLNKQIAIKRKFIFSVTSVLGILPTIIWYFYWVPHLVHTYGFWHFFMGKSIEQGFNEILLNINQTLSRFYDTALKFIGFIVFIYGLVISIVNRESKIYFLFILTLLTFLIIIFKAGFTFPHHSYYIIPFVPVMALIAGFGLTSIKYSKISMIILIAISIEGIANQQHDFRIKDNDKQILNLEIDLLKVSQKEDLIIINSGSYPTPMYFAHRKGWVNSNEEILNESYINELKKKGLKFIVILKRSFGTEILLNQYSKVLENEDYCIYKL